MRCSNFFFTRRSRSSWSHSRWNNRNSCATRGSFVARGRRSRIVDRHDLRRSGLGLGVCSHRVFCFGNGVVGLSTVVQERACRRVRREGQRARCMAGCSERRNFRAACRCFTVSSINDLDCGSCWSDRGGNRRHVGDRVGNSRASFSEVDNNRQGSTDRNVGRSNMARIIRRTRGCRHRGSDRIGRWMGQSRGTRDYCRRRDRIARGFDCRRDFAAPTVVREVWEGDGTPRAQLWYDYSAGRRVELGQQRHGERAELPFRRCRWSDSILLGVHASRS